MLNWFRKIFNIGEVIAEETVEDEPPKRKTGAFSSEWSPRTRKELETDLVRNIFQRTPEDMEIVTSGAMDDVGDISDIKAAYRFSTLNITDTQLSYYGSQGFIGFQLMAVLAQNWLINKA